MKKNILSILICGILLLNCAFISFTPKQTTGGISPLKKLSPSNAPSGFKYKGKIQEVYAFSDNEGEHILVLAQSEEAKSQGKNKEEDMRDINMSVHHLLKGENTYKEIWMAQDYIRDCQFDLVLSMRPESIEVTDLDKDGIAEVSFAYFLACISDVSPYEMKLLMYEGATKYALRGTAKLVDIPSKYTIDASFNTAPKVFLDFAKKKWELFEDQAAG